MTFLRDPVSSASHLLTAGWAVFATLVMLRLTVNRPGRRLPVLIYGASMVLLFLASGTYHGLHYETLEQRRLFQRLDKTAVYLMIAGTYTPIVSILLTGACRVRILTMIWLIAVGGVACLWLLPEDPKTATAAHAAVVGMYLGLGWVGILPLPLYYRAVGWRAMNYVWVGAALYSIGAICELTEWPVLVRAGDWPGYYVGYHEVLHLTHAAASIVFFLFVVRYVIPFRPEPPAPVKRSPVPALQSRFPLHSPVAER
ncbi:PAQR family membrane homeostasis protein TrhA [Frigoriglobus tundricola]|uniref:Hemolysin III n=1 Tax=Frigoriglobus tundricola TaxID=2774151 RepID=A0A6M5Z2K9_9BACT|nr:hemolysin III family protein [Frigoriglobus tundricola]QJW99800.1 hypothetical protein FTUN_7423 [Frigoriglobus tundricola]